MADPRRASQGPAAIGQNNGAALTGYADALMILLKEKVEAATNEMGHFTHKEDDVEGFFHQEDALLAEDTRDVDGAPGRD